MIVKSNRIALMTVLLFMLLPSLFAGPAPTIIVDGAGSGAVNGVYQEFGSSNGKSLFNQIAPLGPYFIEWLPGVGWAIWEQMGAIFYLNTLDTPLPPQSGWLFDPPAIGPPPAPTLSGDVSLPVELTLFAARVTGQVVTLEWTTESELDNLGFILERSDDVANDWLQIASCQTHPELEGQGNTSLRTEYRFSDIDVKPGKNYGYRLSDVSLSGVITVHAPIQISVNDLADETMLEPAYPNPFNPETFLTYRLTEDSQLSVVVVDMLGRPVRELFRGKQPEGSYHVYWNGRLDSGKPAPAGAYLITLKTGNISKVQKVTLVR